MELIGKARFGCFFLVRIGDIAIGARLLERTAASDGGAKFEWYCQVDGSADLSRTNIQKGGGEVFEMRIPMYDKIRDMQYTKLEGELFIRCGPASIQWILGGADGDWIYFPDKRENDISVAISEWDKLSEVDFFDSKLQWKTMPSSENKPVVEDVVPISLPDRYWRGPAIALFLFNSDEISRSVSAAYGQYAEGELLKALSSAIKPDGGWGSLTSSIMGFHGDIVAVSAFGDTPSFVKLRSYLTDTAYGMSVIKTDLNPEFSAQIKQNAEIKYILYGVGLGVVQDKQAVRTHLEMKARNVTGYLGLVYFDLTIRRDWINIYKNLQLIPDMEIDGTICKGWLTKIQDIREVGLK